MPQCAAVVFRVTNNSATPVPDSAGVEITADDGTLQTVVSTGGTLGRTVAAGPGTEEEFVFCWQNVDALSDVTLEVALNGSCVNVTGDSPETVDLGLCSETELCDAIDNNIDGRVNEMPEACGGDPTLVCLNDEVFDNWICARAEERVLRRQRLPDRRVLLRRRLHGRVQHRQPLPERHRLCRQVLRGRERGAGDRRAGRRRPRRHRRCAARRRVGFRLRSRRRRGRQPLVVLRPLGASPPPPDRLDVEAQRRLRLHAGAVRCPHASPASA